MSEKEPSADEFWDLSRLVPRKKPSAARFATGPQTKELFLGEKETALTREDGILHLPANKGELCEESYAPQGNPFITRVTVRRHTGGFDFYESFRRAALLYFEVKGAPAPFVSFYSYMPQYAQMTREQKNYYFYWRGELRAGRYLPTEPSYLYLYVYEILNLPDRIPPEEGICLLCALWRAYRKAHPAIDRYLSVWVQDYCLVHKLPPPTAQLSDFLFEAVAASGFREFYLSDLEYSAPHGTEGLLAYLSDYDWRTGRYAGGEGREIYERCMLETMGTFLKSLLADVPLVGESGDTARLRREAFPCSLCTHSVKCTLEIEYIPLAESQSLRRAVTGAVRHTENRLRAAMGIKSRLSVKDLLPEYAKRVDRAVDAFFAAHSKKRTPPPYEDRYAAIEEAPMSLSDADCIERASWDTTLRLVDAEEARELLAPDTTGEIPPSDATEDVPPTDERRDLSDCEHAFLRGIYEGDETLCRDAVRESGLLTEGLVERINELFAEEIGDIVLEPEGDAFRLVEDYREEIEAWLKK